MIRLLFIYVIAAFKLLNYTYITPNQTINLINESYRPILSETLSIMNIPYSKYKFKLIAFNDNNNLGPSLNRIIFMPGYVGYTEFILFNNNTIKYFTVYINPTNLSYITLYNVILHELSHIHLLGHGEYKNSISGFVIYRDLQNNIIPSKYKLIMTYDDCLGLISSKKYYCIKYIYSF